MTQKVEHAAAHQGLEKPDTATQCGPGPARGILAQGPTPGNFHHARVAPNAALAEFVQHYWIVRWDLRGQPGQSSQSLPHPNLHWVIQEQCSELVGVHTARFDKNLTDVGEVFGVKFRAGAARVLAGRSAASLRNRRIDGALVFGACGNTAVHMLSAHAGDDAAMVQIAEQFLLSLQVQLDAPAKLAGRILDAITSEPELTRVETLCARFELTERGLQRLFHNEVGVSPKWVLNRFRMHEALAQIDAGAVLDWTQFALQLGYFDQAHFVRDFSAITGCSPGQYRGNIEAGRRAHSQGSKSLRAYRLA